MLNDTGSALSLLLTRRSYKPAMLRSPGPVGRTLDAIVAAAIRVPDHGKLTPWRIILIDEAARPAFRDLAERAASANEPDAPPPTAEGLAAARAFGADAPLLMIVIFSPVDHARIPPSEQWLSVGAVCLNALHAAHAQGFGGCWLTGWLSHSAVVADGLGLAPGEAVAGILCLGTPTAMPDERPRPDPAHIARWWTGPAGPT